MVLSLLFGLLSAILSCSTMSHAQSSAPAPATAASGVIRVLAFGDSLTEGWHEVGAPYYPYAKRLGELLEKQMPGKVQVGGAGRGRVPGMGRGRGLSQVRPGREEDVSIPPDSVHHTPGFQIYLQFPIQSPISMREKPRITRPSPSP